MSGFHIPIEDADTGRMLARSAFREWMKQGPGCYCFEEPQDNGEMTAEHFQYIACDPDIAQSEKVPDEALDMVDQYDATKEVILIIRMADGETSCELLDESMLTIRPIDALRAYQACRGEGRLLCGEILNLEKPIEAAERIEPGKYMFKGREGTDMVFEKVELSGDSLRIMGKRVLCHFDYEDCFLSHTIINALLDLE